MQSCFPVESKDIRRELWSQWLITVAVPSADVQATQQRTIGESAEKVTQFR